MLDPRSLLANNTGWNERFVGRTLRLWMSRVREAMRCRSAFIRPLPVVVRLARSGPWPFRTVLRDGRQVTLVSGRDAWMYAHSFGSPEFVLLQLRTEENGVSEFEFASLETGGRVTLELPPTIGDPGIFLSGEYRELPVAGQTVVDIGAGGGETALYFVLKGAGRVLAFEPLLIPYRQALRNLKRNRCENRVTVERKAVGAAPGLVRLSSLEKTATQRALTSIEGDAITEVTTLTDIVSKYDVEKGCLKVDCEGDEYALILNTPAPILRRFTDILVEYHFGYHSLSAHLESAGFAVRAGPPKYSPKSPQPGVYYGTLFAHMAGSAHA